MSSNEKPSFCSCLCWNMLVGQLHVMDMCSRAAWQEKWMMYNSSVNLVYSKYDGTHHPSMQPVANLHPFKNPFQFMYQGGEANAIWTRKTIQNKTWTFCMKDQWYRYSGIFPMFGPRHGIIPLQCVEELSMQFSDNVLAFTTPDARQRTQCWYNSGLLTWHFLRKTSCYCLKEGKWQKLKVL